MKTILKGLLMLMAVAFVWGGAGETYVALTNRSPKAMTCEEFARSRPDAKWLSLTECAVNVEDIVEVSYRIGVVEGYYAPLVPRGAAGTPSSLLVKAKTKEQLGRLARQHEYVGVVQFGIENVEMVREAIERSKAKLAENYMILDPSQAPQLGQSAGMLVLGLLMGAYFFRGLLRGAPAGARSKAPVRHGDRDAVRPGAMGHAKRHQDQEEEVHELVGR